MDLLHFVDQRLGFIKYFHGSTAAVFEETIRKIEAGEPPYVDRRDPEYADEPEFLEEWENADAAVNITGATCLELLQSTFHSFLEEYMKLIGGEDAIPRIGEMRKKSWFGNYKAFFIEILRVDWDASGADVGLLEQVILTRNDFAHNPDFMSLNAYQTLQHSKKYPKSAFVDPRWRALTFDRKRIVVPSEVLEKSSAAVHRLCEYLEGKRGRIRVERVS